MRNVISAIAFACVSGLCFVSCSGSGTQENKTVVKDTTVKPKWQDPQQGKIWGKVNYVQIPLTAIENHILGPVKSVRYTEYIMDAKDGTRALADSGYNVYDEAGHLIDQNEYSNDGKPKWKCVYNYEQDRAALWDIKVYRSNDMSRVTFKYDDKGRKIEQDEASEKKEDSRKIIYTYDDKGNETGEDEHFGNGREWITNFKYDDKGRQTEYTQRDPAGKLQMKMTQEYDDAGNRISGTTYMRDTLAGEKWTAKNDSKGRCIELLSYAADGSIRSKNIMKYDDWDNMIEDLHYRPDGSIDTAGWNTYTEFEYDNHGNAIKETAYKLKAGQKVMTGVAEKKYEYY